MFNIQPGQGLGFTGSKQIALGLGGFEEIIIPEAKLPGGGSKRSRKHVPGVTSNLALAFREDEEIIAAIEAFLNSRIH